MIISITFFVFLLIGALVYWLHPGQHLRKGFLILASLGFLGIYDKFSVLVLVLLSIYTYSLAILIEIRKNPAIHRVGICGLILVLAIFKYLGLLTATISDLVGFFSSLPAFHCSKLLLPIGISYLVFKYISYLTDVQWGVVGKGNFLDLLLYGSLFTIYMAGPIERFERFKTQVETPTTFKLSNLEIAFQRIVYGLFKKLVIADWVGYFIDPLWMGSGRYGFLLKALALFGFSIQIYMDFSGYSDIAIGSSRLFGLTIMENFNWPYLQPNISKFWRNWHISLSDWIRDYVFFPLSRKSESWVWLTISVPLIAMGLCGLWHGAAWHFLWWGMWHGAGLAAFQIWSQWKRKNRRKNQLAHSKLSPVLSTVSTFIFVSIGWLLFR
jgi:alginate O-acetyltransferase complex protein AlgI